jgi:RNA polymerase sigma factor (sigma-70 family)
MAEIERVIAEFGPALGRVAAAYASAPADRDDLSQEIALALVRALPQYRGESSLRTYVLRIAHNCGIKRIARRRASGAPLEEAEHPTPSPNPERELDARQQVETLAAAVRELPLGARQVLVLTLEGLSQREIGDVLGLDENAVSVRMHRARKALRERLQRKESSHG